MDGRREARGNHRGQSLAEFALIFPLMFVIFVAVIDLARVYTTILSVESAAREAADWGSFQSSNWAGNESNPASNRAKTIEHYKAFIDLWKGADRELQPAVAQARQRLAALERAGGD